MVGALVIAFVLLVVIPAGVLITSAVVAAVLGQTTKSDVDRRFEDTEYLGMS